MYGQFGLVNLGRIPLLIICMAFAVAILILWYKIYSTFFTERTPAFITYFEVMFTIHVNPP